MSNEKKSAGVLLVALAILAMGSAAINWIYHGTVVDRLEAIRMEQQMESVMAAGGTLTTTWASGGMERSWSSTWKEFDTAETFDEFLDRHAAEVVKCQKKFPKDEPPRDE